MFGLVIANVALPEDELDCVAIKVLDSCVEAAAVVIAIAGSTTWSATRI
jgi:hypothetical protein